MAKIYNGTAWIDNEKIAVDKKLDISYLPVANGTHFNGNLGAASTSLIQTRCRQTRKLLRIIASGADKLQVEWANKYTTTVVQASDASCELNGPNSVTARMAIEYPAGTPRIISGSTTYSAGTAYAVGDQIVSSGIKYVCIQAGTGQTPASSPLYWRVVNTYVVRWTGDTDSNGTIAFAPGDYKQSLPVQLLEKTYESDKIAVLGAFDSGGSSNYIPYAGANGASNHGQFVDWVVDAAGGLPAVGSALPDTGVTNQTNANTTSANAGDNLNWMKIPYATAITGNIPESTCVAIFGDSIAQGYGGDMRDGEPCGVFPRALDGVSWWRIAQGGNKAQCYTKSNAPWQYSVVSRCSAIVCNMGLNDIMGGATAAQLKTYLTRLWDALAAQGKPLYTGMLTPISASSDSWATTTNQSRYINGGAIATTQFATTADYATTVYGQTALWLSQDGASVTIDGTAYKAGQVNHPLKGIFSWRNIMADLSTSWRWGAGLTSDGAHPNALCVSYEVTLLQPQLEPLVLGRRQPPPPVPGTGASGEVQPIVAAMPRDLVSTLNTAAAGSVMTVLGTSPGKWISQARAWVGTTLSGGNTLAWTLLAGQDVAFMKVLGSGPVNTTANSIATLTLPSLAWIPAGQLLVLVVGASGANTMQVGGHSVLANGSALLKSGSVMPMAGTSADNAVLTGNINMFTKWTTTGLFRAWGEAV
jgi:hypothetical protein